MASLCRVVEGLPLAVELTAAQLRAHSLEELTAQVCKGLEPLRRRRARPTRHRSLTEAIDWSHRLLGPGEQHCLARLSVFAGGCTVTAAQQLTEPSAGSEAVLADLVERSLVTAEHGDTTRYRLLEPVRQFAALRLRATGDEHAARRRHAAIFRRLAEQADERYAPAGTDILRARSAVLHELANLRAALEWSLGPGGDLDCGMRLAGAVTWLWTGLPREGLHWAKRFLDHVGGADPSHEPLVRYAAGLICFSTDLHAAAGHLARAASLAEQHGDARMHLEALAQLSIVCYLMGRADRAFAIADAVAATAARYGTALETARADIALGVAWCGLGELARAQDLLGKAQTQLAADDHRAALATCHWAWAEAAHYSGRARRSAELSAAALGGTAAEEDLFATACRHSQAARNLLTAGQHTAGRSHLTIALRHCLDQGLWMPAVDALVTSSRLAADTGRPVQAVTLQAAAQALRRRTGRRPAPVERPGLRSHAQALRSLVPLREYAQARHAGAAIAPEAALRLALATAAADEAAATAGLAVW
ncbi:hypothetical protein ACZ90_54110 [Streptomyces albus subsp. albus]|nr:hypothetical protein ACZ90_54110 [Streptomyces albus subsp. albus]